MQWSTEQLDAWRKEAYKNSRKRKLTHDEAQDAASQAILELLRVDPNTVNSPDKFASALILNVICDAYNYHDKRKPLSYGSLQDRNDHSFYEQASHEQCSLDYMEMLDVFQSLTDKQQVFIREVAVNMSSISRYHGEEIAESMGINRDYVRHLLLAIRRHALEKTRDDS